MMSLSAILACLRDKLEAASVWAADSRDPFARPYRADATAASQAPEPHPHDWRRFTITPSSLATLETSDLGSHRFEAECLLDVHYPPSLTAELLADLLTTESSLIRSLLEDSADTYPACLIAAWLRRSEADVESDGVCLHHHLTIQFEHLP